jgi:NAD(P)-dependent dehydrogenase (short-subunit alcohol dehydrogenase family)
MKSVLITGICGGIGAAIASAFATEGYRVIGIDRQEPLASSDYFIPIDLSVFSLDPSYRDERLDEIRSATQGTLHTLINGAAIQRIANTEQVSLDDWNATLAVNLLAPFFLSQALVSELERNRGGIINISSIHGHLTKPSFVCYATSKAALTGLTRAMAVDLGGRVRVNAIAPAAIDTEMLRAGFAQDPNAFAELAEAHPIGRIGQPAEVAQLAVFLASDQAPFMTGSVVDIGGAIGARLHDPA